jgi:hypothetical protein
MSALTLDIIWGAIATKVVDLIHRTECRGVRVIKTDTQSVGNATPVAISYNTMVYDTEGSMWAVGDPTKLVAARDGYYLAGGAWSLLAAQNTAASRVQAMVLKNGVTYLGAAEVHSIVGKIVVSAVATGMFWMSAGDYIQLIAQHDEGGSKTSQAATAANQHLCNGWLMRVG